MHIRLAQPLYVKNFTTIDGRGADVHVAGGAGIVGNMMPAVARGGGGGGKDQWHWHSVGDAFENGAFFRQVGNRGAPQLQPAPGVPGGERRRRRRSHVLCHGGVLTI
ncbi:hypothetical protein OsI_28616 [Oryza sativa Indica Group]|uniref:Uncharacterized protein n=1 Tax=Oryza sativa subsp. indica TaxID=39946 RepID=A2YTH6_ORYSI|nr:hypothetical protein OsI_28616 [Oryza sativa Indica Group]